MRRFVFLAFLSIATRADAQAPLRLEERFVPNAAYHVSCRVRIAGQMTLPGKSLDIEGQSHIEYDERILHVADGGVVDKTVRLFSSMQFERTIGMEHQKNALRPAVHRLVIVRQNNIEAPFSPDGPLKLSEVDLIRTDVFTPALTGMLPKSAVSPGATWKADESATRELTDLVQITAGELLCRFDKVDKSRAKVSFEGTIRGVGENGPTKHDLEGFFYFDLSSKTLSYVSLKGTEHLLNDKGQAQGKVTGTFVLTREPRAAPAAIAETANVAVDPTEDNTRLLFEDEDLGVRFAHSRKWKPRVEGGQVKLDGERGNGMVLTVDPLSRLPTLQQFLGEARSGIERRKGLISFTGAAQTLQRQPAIETLALDGEVPAERASQRVKIVLAVIRDEMAGATLAATLVTSDRNALVGEVQRLAASVRVGKGK